MTCDHCMWCHITLLLEWLNKDYRNTMEVVSSEKPKHILKDKLIKYNPPSEKPKRIEWGFLKVITILDIL